jgi:hypothetical protein
MIVCYIAPGLYILSSEPERCGVPDTQQASQSPPSAVPWEYITLVSKIVHLTMNGITHKYLAVEVHSLYVRFRSKAFS